MLGQLCVGGLRVVFVGDGEVVLDVPAKLAARVRVYLARA
jgi:hypothetical protein